MMSSSTDANTKVHLLAHTAKLQQLETSLTSRCTLTVPSTTPTQVLPSFLLPTIAPFTASTLFLPQSRRLSKHPGWEQDGSG